MRQNTPTIPIGLTASFVTVSLGVANIIPSDEKNAAILVQAAREALEKSKKTVLQL